MKGFIEDTSLQDIADAIREKTGEETALKPSEMGEAIRGIGGSVDYMSYATDLNTMFQLADFTDNPNVVINVPKFLGISIATMFNSATNIKTIKMICEVRNMAMTATTSFYNVKTVTEIDLSEFNTLFSSCSSLFGSCLSLKTILGTLDFSHSQTLVNTFGNCPLLEEVRLAEQCIKVNVGFPHSSVLSAESIQSIIDGLVDLTGQTAQTITFHSNIVSKLTDEQKLTILSKNWQLG